MPSKVKVRRGPGAGASVRRSIPHAGSAGVAGCSRFSVMSVVRLPGALSLQFLVLAACLVGWQPVQAQPRAGTQPLDVPDGHAGGAAANISTIGPVLQHSSGTAVVNQAAGTGNVQQNSAAIAHGAGHSVAMVDGRQASQRAVTSVDQLLVANIESGAFEGARGIYLVNQSAGAGNSQFNGAAIAVGGVSALGVVQLDDARLLEHRADTGAPVLHDEGGAKVSASANLAPDAFAGARGLFLVNQAAGNNNATANSFTLSASP